MLHGVRHRLLARPVGGHRDARGQPAPRARGVGSDAHGRAARVAAHQQLERTGQVDLGERRVQRVREVAQLVVTQVGEPCGERLARRADAPRGGLRQEQLGLDMPVQPLRHVPTGREVRGSSSWADLRWEPGRVDSRCSHGDDPARVLWGLLHKA
jgi:hypothetical protein